MERTRKSVVDVTADDDDGPESYCGFRALIRRLEDKVTQQISIKILVHLVNKNLLQMCFRCKYAFLYCF